jgi:23S rRNA (adenine-N6)-dimethyltransferase
VAARRTRSRSGRHFLGRRAAAELVDSCGFGPADLVFEIGAGRGVLTRELAERARRVIAVELDPALASRLSRRYAGSAVVDVREGDALQVPLPAESFRAFGNIPFGITTALLRRLLDDPRLPLRRADLVVQREVARKRSDDPPGNLRSCSWGPWWRFEAGLLLRADSFHPPPRVDGRVLTITRRESPLLPTEDRHEFVRFLERAFRRAGEPLTRALRDPRDAGPSRTLFRVAGVSKNDRPVDLTVHQWVALFLSQR